MTDPTIPAWSRENDLLFAIRQLREENELLKTRREWVGLTEAELEECGHEALRLAFVNRASSAVMFAQTIEAKLKEKNALPGT